MEKGYRIGREHSKSSSRAARNMLYLDCTDVSMMAVIYDKLLLVEKPGTGYMESLFF